MAEKKFSEASNEDIWRDLRSAEKPDLAKVMREMIREPLNVEPGWCCRAVRKAMAAGLNHIALASGSGFTFVRVFFCPQCGRKL